MHEGATGLDPEELLTFWFGQDPARPLAMAEKWFIKDEAFDEEVRRRFGEFQRSA